MKKALKNKSQWQNKDIKNKIEKLEKAIHTARHTQEQTNKTTIERLYQQIKRWKAKKIRHTFPTSRKSIESLRDIPRILGSGFFSRPQKKNVNAKEYYINYSAKGCQLCGHYYRKKE